jgi:hypothetical protein
VASGALKDAARILVADIVREQLDEETGMRGYIAARGRILRTIRKPTRRARFTSESLALFFPQCRHPEAV